MKKKITAVLLCLALLLTLSVSVSADTSTANTQPLTDTQITPITDEVTVNVGENDVEIIESEISDENMIMPLAQTSGIVSGGVYRIKNVASGKYMNVDYGIDANGTNIYQWTGDGSTEQKFKIVYSSSTDSYMFYAMCSSNGTNRVVDVTRGSSPLTNGQNVKLYNPTDPTSQEIKIISVGSGKYRLAMRANTALGLAAYGTSNGSAGGTSSTSAGNIFLSTYTGSTNQQWQFELLENPNTSSAPTGYLDSVSTTQIGGWAYQSNIPNTALTVHIYIINNSTGEQKIIPVTAGGYRADLKNAGYGNGYHAFHYAINWKTYKPGTYTVRAYAIGVNSSNPQLTNSPKSFTVRNIQGNVEYLDSDGIGGWVWKPDAPNSTIDAHVYIYKLDGTQVAFYPVTASQPRSDLAAAGYGNGAHGFSKTIDWASLPEEKLRVVVYAVDGSGYNPSFYVGYYDNRMPIHLIGMIDDEGIDFSSWATTEIINYAYNIGTPRVVKCIGATKESLLQYIKDSSFATVYTHGSQRSISWSKYNGTTEEKGTLLWNDFLTMDSEYFSKTRCLLLLSCCAAGDSEYPATNNMVNVFEAKGVQTVVGFKNEVWFWYFADRTIDNSFGSGRWAKVFVENLSEGATVRAATTAAIEDAITSFEDIEELDDEKRYEDAYETAKGYGLVDVDIVGDEYQVVKH